MSREKQNAGTSICCYSPETLKHDKEFYYLSTLKGMLNYYIRKGFLAKL